MAEQDEKLISVSIDEVWDDLRPRLEVLRARFALEWRPEDIYMEVRQGHFVILRAESETAYVVVRKEPMRHTDGDQLFIWVAVGDGDDIIKRFQSALDNVALDGGAERIVFETPRSGFLRLDGWKPVMTIYHRYLR